MTCNHIITAKLFGLNKTLYNFLSKNFWLKELLPRMPGRCKCVSLNIPSLSRAICLNHNHPCSLLFCFCYSVTNDYCLEFLDTTHTQVPR